jgi:hypothetical protein
LKASLGWTGSQWQWVQHVVTQPVMVQVVWDLQVVMLVQVRGETGGQRWSVWLERRAQPVLWHALRCALYAPVLPTAVGLPRV